MLLRDKALVVLFLGARAGKRDRLLLTVGHQGGVDELAAIIGIAPQHGEWD
jgi:hypothetical protein